MTLRKKSKYLPISNEVFFFLLWTSEKVRDDSCQEEVLGLSLGWVLLMDSLVMIRANIPGQVFPPERAIWGESEKYQWQA